MLPRLDARSSLGIRFRRGEGRRRSAGANRVELVLRSGGKRTSLSLEDSASRSSRVAGGSWCRRGSCWWERRRQIYRLSRVAAVTDNTSGTPHV